MHETAPGAARLTASPTTHPQDTVNGVRWDYEKEPPLHTGFSSARPLQAGAQPGAELPASHPQPNNGDSNRRDKSLDRSEITDGPCPLLGDSTTKGLSENT